MEIGEKRAIRVSDKSEDRREREISDRKKNDLPGT